MPSGGWPWSARSASSSTRMHPCPRRGDVSQPLSQPPDQERERQAWRRRRSPASGTPIPTPAPGSHPRLHPVPYESASPYRDMVPSTGNAANCSANLVEGQCTGVSLQFVPRPTSASRVDEHVASVRRMAMRGSPFNGPTMTTAAARDPHRHEQAARDLDARVAPCV